MTTEPKKATAKKPAVPKGLGAASYKLVPEVVPGDAIWVLKHVTEVHTLAGGQRRLVYDDGTTATLAETTALPMP
jgi:hypothetical protein